MNNLFPYRKLRKINVLKASGLSVCLLGTGAVPLNPEHLQPADAVWGGMNVSGGVERGGLPVTAYGGASCSGLCRSLVPFSVGISVT